MTEDQMGSGVRHDWRVAVVDDDPGVRRSVGRLLRVAGFDVFTFASAEDFLTSATTAFRCLVLDLELGGQSGLELHVRLERDHRACPVVFITSHEDDFVALPSEPHCARLRKPFEARDLIAAIRRVAGGEHEAGCLDMFPTRPGGPRP